MTLLFKIINLMANLKILSDPLLALQMLYEGKGGGEGGEFGENYELGTVSKFNIIPVTSKWRRITNFEPYHNPTSVS